MAAPPSIVPFHVATHKLSFHGAVKDWKTVVQRIVEDLNTDVWCLQDTSARHLKLLPDGFRATGSRGITFVSRSASVQLHAVAYVNMASLLVKASQQCTAVTDSIPVSTHHLCKLPLVVGFAAWDVTGQRASNAHGVVGRVLVVNVDFERVRSWSTEFQSSLVYVLCRQVWGDVNSYTQQWGCRHVCFAGSFFFAPGSIPYTMLTSHSGGLREVVNSVVVVKPFACCHFDEVHGGGSAAAKTFNMCVVARVAQRIGEMQEVLGIHFGGAKKSKMPVRELQAFFRRDTATTYSSLELIPETEEGWWKVAKPLDTSVSQEVMLRLQWPAEEMDESNTASDLSPDLTPRIHLLVRSGGVLPPQCQEMEGLVGVCSPLLSSVMAGTCAGKKAVAATAELEALCLKRGQVLQPTNGISAECGEPVITALYRENVPIPPGCYDYIFVSTFTGITVESKLAHDAMDFAQEQLTAHLPLFAHLVLPASIP
ncbi:hypothetical protein, conserved [Leishmania shawi]|uniref:Uncharacterized protein n=1 Tax=Leishmania shawi TaxID=5680 RepID=A0ABR3ECT6_9TRYP